MAFIWLDTEGNGVVVQETAAEVRRKIEDEDDDTSLIEFLRDTEGGDEEAFRSIFISYEHIVAIETGRGVGAVR